MRAIFEGWSASHIPPQAGKSALVTGANSGIGYETALALGRAGARVTIGCRDEQRGRDAVARLLAAVPGASFAVEALDLADLGSVRAMATRWLDGGMPLDLLVNNAGVMALPKREVTVDGFERQIGTKLFHMNGPPVEVKLPERAKDEANASALWERSEALTAVRYADAPTAP